jgi:hypothetical protein
MLFGMAVLASRGLAFPIGVHAAWNAGSWLLGMKDEAGYWRLEPGRQPSFAEGAAIYLTVIAVSMLTLWWWMRRAAAGARARREFDEVEQVPPTGAQ